MRYFDIERVEKEKPSPPSQPAKRAGLLPYLLGLLLGLVLVFGIVKIQGGEPTKEQPKQETKTFAESTETKTTETEAVAETPAEQPQAQPALDKSKIIIQILNGNGIRGDAYKTKLILEKDGFKVATYGNAGSFKYQYTFVYHKQDGEEAAKAIAETLKNAGRQTAIHESSTLNKYDILVIVGKK